MTKYISQLSILYVEDDYGIRQALGTTLEMWAKKLYIAEDALTGLELYEKYSPDIIISDIKMPGMDGMQMIRKIREKNSDIPILIITALNDTDVLHNAIELQVDHYIMKPVSIKDLKRHLESNAKSILFEREQIRHNKLLQKIIDKDKDMLVVINYNKIIFANQALKEFFHYNYEKIKKNTEDFFKEFISIEGFLHSEMLRDDDTFIDLIKRTEDSKRIVSLYNFDDGEPKAYYINISQIEDDLYILHFIDITEMAIEKKLLEKKAYYDKLTQIFNRTKFDDLLEYEVKRNHRYNSNLSLILFDIDHFKSVNDTYGHMVGDEVLKTIAKVVKEKIRETDIFARWGGEEFVILMPQTDIDNAITIAEYIRELLESTVHKDVGKSTCSFGLTSLKENDRIEEFLERADDALYKAKKNGRNRVEIEL